MITYFTVLLMSYQLSGEALQTKMIFASQRQCQQAMEGIYPSMLSSFQDVVVQCRKSELMSSTPRPKTRPEK